MLARLCLVAALAISGGCAFVPKESVRLDEARRAHARLAQDAAVARLAPEELRQADEALGRAVEAWGTLQDPALVDHLAYVAKQRARIAEESAVRAAAQQALERRARAGERS